MADADRKSSFSGLRDHDLRSPVRNGSSNQLVDNELSLGYTMSGRTGALAWARTVHFVPLFFPLLPRRLNSSS